MGGSDLFSWLLDVGGVFGAIAKSLSPEPLVQALNAEVVEWAKDDAVAVTGERNPDALLAHLFATSITEAPERERLRDRIERRELPDAQMWFAALYERWEQIRTAAGNDARPFFKLPADEAEILLRDLAKRLERICLKADQSIAIGALVDRLDEMRSEIMAARSERFSLSEARTAFLDYSQPLLKWPTSLAKTGHRIDRPEQKKILSRIEEHPSSVTVLLGERGSGKSALLANVAAQIRDNGWTLFAIKADLLNETTDDEMAAALGLRIPLAQLLREAARQNTTVLIIDQLDAVAEIADRSARRLNFLLNLVHRVAGISNLHVVVSSRPFEFHTDTRLRTVNADEIELALPPWDQVVPIVTRAGHAPETFGEPLTELLRIPWALDVYLRVATPNQHFGSLTHLLEALWEIDVTSSDNAADRAQLLDEICVAMTCEEHLAVPASVADRYPAAAVALRARDFIIVDQHQLSFRHQTFYEFILSRRFARDEDAFIAHVVAGQDGLFVRPSVLATLMYMRDTSRSRYHRVVEVLLTRSDIRLHIRSLALDFLASQRDPDAPEVRYILARLRNRSLAPRILFAAASSPKWFPHFRDLPAFRKILRDPTRASYALGALSSAMQTQPEDVLQLVHDEWADDSKFDAFTAQVILAGRTFEGRALLLASIVVARSDQEWLIEGAAKTAPEAAIQLLCADLDRRIRTVISAEKSQKYMQTLQIQAMKIASRYEMVDDLAVTAPAAFLHHFWPWFECFCESLTDSSKTAVMHGYRSIWTFEVEFEFSAADMADGETIHFREPTLLDTLMKAARTMAENDPRAFKEFVEQHRSTDIAILHVILATGLEVVAETDPAAAIDYLLADSRRLLLGLDSSRSTLTTKIIAATYARVDSGRRRALDASILSFDKFDPQSANDEERRRRMIAWNREHRLVLLDAVPDEAISDDVAAIRARLRVEFPNAHEARPRIRGGTVGPRVTASELREMTDDQRMEVCDQTTDADEERSFSFDVEISRSGGVHEQASAFAEALKTQPDRALALLPRLDPKKHQHYAAAVVESLRDHGAADDLMHIAADLDVRGFTSFELRARVGAVLEQAAKRHGGLHDSTIAMLERWLSDAPVQPDSPQPNHRDSERPEALIVTRYGLGMMTPIPHRAQILSAIAAGLLSRTEPPLDRWSAFFRGQIAADSTKTFWWHMLQYMPALLNSDTEAANEALDELFAAHAHLIHDTRILLFLGLFMRRLSVKLVRQWIASLRTSNDESLRQAFGELVMLGHVWNGDAWSDAEIASAVENRESAVLIGIGFVAPLAWSVSRVRRVSAMVLRTIALNAANISTAPIKKFLADAVGEPMDRETAMVLRAVLRHREASHELTSAILNVAEAHVVVIPKLARDIAKRVLQLHGAVLNTGGDFRVASQLTSIAITLHRQHDFRREGLALFERLIKLNVREADAALEILDRRPTRRLAHFPLRGHYRRAPRRLPR